MRHLWRLPLATAVALISLATVLVAFALLSRTPAADNSRPAPAPGDGLGRAYHYGLDGSDVTQVVTPRGWTPLRGTDQELRTYGFPPRPTDQAGLQRWTASFSGWRGSAAEGMCETNRFSGPASPRLR